MELQSSVWSVDFSKLIEEEGKRPWNRNYSIMVVAPTLEIVISGVKDVHPTANFHAIHRRGTDKTLLVIEATG
jgi:hypothetical protein